MNVQLVESLAQIVLSLSSEERSLFEKKINPNIDETSAGQWRLFDKISTPQEKAKAFREWASSNSRNMPYLSDEAISRESIYPEEQERPFYETATPEEWVRAFREWASSHPRNMPYLSDEAISRESIYGERG